jgi:hypothetical protein
MRCRATAAGRTSATARRTGLQSLCGAIFLCEPKRLFGPFSNSVNSRREPGFSFGHLQGMASRSSGIDFGMAYRKRKPSGNLDDDIAPAPAPAGRWRRHWLDAGVRHSPRVDAKQQPNAMVAAACDFGRDTCRFPSYRDPSLDVSVGDLIGIGICHRSGIFGACEILGNSNGGSNYLDGYLETKL